MPRRFPIFRRMFHRRLVLLAAMGLLPMFALTTQLGRLTIAQHDERAAIAESKLVAVRWLPTSRGRILDRQGRELAFDRASFDLTIDYSLLDGRWASLNGARAARRLHRADWGTLTPEAKDQVIERYRAVYRAHAESVWSELAMLTQRPEAELREAADKVVARVERMHGAIVSKRLENMVDEQLEERRTLEGIDVDRLRDEADRPIAEQRAPHVILRDVGDPIGFRVLKLLDTMIEIPMPADTALGLPATRVELELLPGVEIQDTVERIYPQDEITVAIDTSSFPGPLAAARSDAPIVEMTVNGVAVPILGRMRDKAFAEDAQRRREWLAEAPGSTRDRVLTEKGTDRGRYLGGDASGHIGMEFAQEHRLRGLRGVRIRNLETGVDERIESEPGRDLRLTIDVNLQARVRALMDPQLGLSVVQDWHGDPSSRPATGTHLYGGAAVLDVATGEILALVSTPTVPRDGDWSVYGLQDNQVELFRELTRPEVHKAIAKPYPPGSVAKAMVLAGAEHFGAYDLSERIPATGHLYPDRPDILRSWIFKQFGITHRDQLQRDPDGSDALMVSSNVFFFTLGQRMTGAQIAQTYQMFGLGESFNLGIGAEFPGKVGPFGGPGDGSDLASWDQIQLGIGQGPVTWTPLHAAAAYATLARRGIYVKPRIIQDGTPPEARELPISQNAISTALLGLKKVVSDPDHATGRVLNTPLGQEVIWNAPGIEVWGKTGTATAPPLRADPDGPEGPLEPQTFLEGDHSWFVVMAGEAGGPPRYVVAVVMDYAGSGGRVSGPVANQIVHALVAEGYLQGTGAAPAATTTARAGGN